ncbi:MAG: hypothetical protein AAF567_22370 [Actinomycetota bacterium]
MIRQLRLLVTLIASVVLVSACASADTPIDPRAEVATANEANLELSGELATTQMLDVMTGNVRSLDDVVTGDRAVLLWYWAPD